MGEDGHCGDRVCCWMSLLVCVVLIMADCVQAFQLGFICVLMFCKEFEYESYFFIVQGLSKRFE